MATDGSSEVVDELQSNLVLNGLDGTQTIQARELKWGHALINGIHGRQEEPRSYQLVLGADLVCYNLLFVLGLDKQKFESIGWPAFDLRWNLDPCANINITGDFCSIPGREGCHISNSSKPEDTRHFHARLR